MPPLEKVRSGQSLKIPASTWNAFVDTANNARFGNRMTSGGMTGGGAGGGVVLVSNKDGVGFRRGDVCAIHLNVFNPSTQEDAFVQEPLLSAWPPSGKILGAEVLADRPLGIMLDPVMAINDVGRAVVAGIAAARVYMNDPHHVYATWKEELTPDYHILESAFTGPVKILTNTGDASAIGDTVWHYVQLPVCPGQPVQLRIGCDGVYDGFACEIVGAYSNANAPWYPHPMSLTAVLPSGNSLQNVLPYNGPPILSGYMRTVHVGPVMRFRMAYGDAFSPGDSVGTIAGSSILHAEQYGFIALGEETDGNGNRYVYVVRAVGDQIIGTGTGTNWSRPASCNNCNPKIASTLYVKFFDWTGAWAALNGECVTLTQAEGDECLWTGTLGTFQIRLGWNFPERCGPGVLFQTWTFTILDTATGAIARLTIVGTPDPCAPQAVYVPCAGSNYAVVGDSCEEIEEIPSTPTASAGTEPPSTPTASAGTEPPSTPTASAGTEPPSTPTASAGTEPPSTPTATSATFGPPYLWQCIDGQCFQTESGTYATYIECMLNCIGACPESCDACNEHYYVSANNFYTCGLGPFTGVIDVGKEATPCLWTWAQGTIPQIDDGGHGLLRFEGLSCVLGQWVLGLSTDDWDVYGDESYVEGLGSAEYRTPASPCPTTGDPTVYFKVISSCDYGDDLWPATVTVY